MGVTIKNRTALLSSLVLAVREVLIYSFVTATTRSWLRTKVLYLRFLLRGLRNIRFVHVISRTRLSRFSTCNIKSWEWPGDEASRLHDWYAILNNSQTNTYRTLMIVDTAATILFRSLFWYSN